MPAPLALVPAAVAGLKALGAGSAWMGAFNGLMGLSNLVGTGLYLKDSLGGGSGGEVVPEGSEEEREQMRRLLGEERARDRSWMTRSEMSAHRQRMMSHG